MNGDYYSNWNEPYEVELREQKQLTIELADCDYWDGLRDEME